MKYDVVIIGAGPGGIFSAYELMKQNNDLKIAVFEAGNPLSYHLDPEKSVFLDDRAENCEAARKQGIHAIQFKSFKQAAAELEKLGVN